MVWLEPTTDEPAVETMMEWSDEDRCQSTDGCWLDGKRPEYEHGHPSWAVVLGFVPDGSGDCSWRAARLDEIWLR